MTAQPVAQLGKTVRENAAQRGGYPDVALGDLLLRSDMEGSSNIAIWPPGTGWVPANVITAVLV